MTDLIPVLHYVRNIDIAGFRVQKGSLGGIRDCYAYNNSYDVGTSILIVARQSMFRILESQAPAKQNAPDTINTLSGRLQSATLLEDRRAAILGLRSFARIYPASVASGALRNLINSLNHDGDDVDTTKVVLETLLMLFNPEESSVSW